MASLCLETWEVTSDTSSEGGGGEDTNGAAGGSVDWVDADLGVRFPFFGACRRAEVVNWRNGMPVT